VATHTRHNFCSGPEQLQIVANAADQQVCIVDGEQWRRFGARPIAILFVVCVSTAVGVVDGHAPHAVPERCQPSGGHYQRSRSRCRGGGRSPAAAQPVQKAVPVADARVRCRQWHHHATTSCSRPGGHGSLSHPSPAHHTPRCRT